MSRDKDEFASDNTFETFDLNLDSQTRSVINFIRAKSKKNNKNNYAPNDKQLRTSILPYDLGLVNPAIDKAEPDPTLFFRDGIRKIDMVLAYEDEEIDSNRPISVNHYAHKRRQARKTFQENLELAGLELEFEHKCHSFDRKTNFVKIHAPKALLERNSEIMNMKKPIKEFIVTYYTSRDPKSRKAYRSNTWWLGDLTSKSVFNCDTVTPEPNIFFPGFVPDILDKYVLKERCDELSNIQRTQIVWQILTRVRYDNSSREKAGIARLINKNVYTAVYPLHEGEIDYHDEQENIERANERMVLFREWASLKNWYRKQPLWLIKKYFGVKIGLYFAWLGFYTQALIIPAVVGILCFMFGISTMFSPLNRASTEICDESLMGNATMCPQCDKYCPFWKLKDSCILSRVTYTFDNSATVFFAIFMSVWATTYLEVWKRRQAILQWEWDLNTEEEDDEIRPEYEQGVRTTRLNPITQKREPYVSAKEKVIRISLTSSIVLFMLVAVIAAVFSVLLFRILLITFMYERTHSNPFLSQFAKIIATLLAASINAIVIEVSGYVFQIIARKITSLEHPRTQADYENSYTFKMFLFQFINYYSSLVYTAFFKGRFFTHPGDSKTRNSLVARLKTDMCDPAGCIYELFFMLSVYMIARQLFSNSMELYFPKFKNWLRKLVLKYQLRSLIRSSESTDEEDFDTKKVFLKRWEADYQLERIDRLHLFDEYIEMVIQYGFVTLFVAAFPLAPLLALINNIFEIRLDAYKYTTLMRRPLGQQVRNIGIWYKILEGMTYLSVVFNAFVIALTSDFIPKMVYAFVESPNLSLEGYINSTLSVFDTGDWGDPMDKTVKYYGPEIKGNETQQPYDTCRYVAYRVPPGEPEEYSLSRTWLHVFVARLAFVAVFEHLVLILNSILAYAIPDVPNNLRTQLLRERQLEREIEFQKLHVPAAKQDNLDSGDDANGKGDGQYDEEVHEDMHLGRDDDHEDVVNDANFGPKDKGETLSRASSTVMQRSRLSPRPLEAAKHRRNSISPMFVLHQ